MNEKLIKDNFFLAVNEKWLKETEIPADKPSFSTFAVINEKVESLLIEKSNLWKDGKEEIPKFELLDEYVTFYKMASDFEKREELGIKPALRSLEEIRNLKSLDDLNKNYHNLLLNEYHLPFMFYISQDFKDSKKQKLAFHMAGLFLPSKEYYENEEQKKSLLELFKKTAGETLKEYKLSDFEIEKILNNAISFDSMLVKYTPSSVERAKYVEMYNLLKMKDVAKKSKYLDIKGITKKLVGRNVPEIIIPYLPYLDALEKLFVPENFEIIKSWLYLKEALSLAKYLTEKLRYLSGAFGRALMGQKEPRPKEKAAYYLANEIFSEHLGKYYGVTFFGEKAREDVRKMVYKMIDIYKERLKEKEWLKKSTRNKAIKKLDKLGVQVGYPDEFAPYYKKIEITPYEKSGDIVLNIKKFHRLENEYSFSQYLKPVNKNLWSMPASMVNAYYSPFINQIVFPAAILRDPYYDFNNTKSQNYGGIGAVMAHEISHAFDNNGSLIDDNGNLNKWWTDSDIKNFNKIRDEVIKQFDGIPILSGAKCNGELTVSENIADNGGFNCALMAAQKESDFNPKEFFTNWVSIWRVKSRKEYEELLMRLDVHSPGELRANMQLKNCDLFYEVYNIKEGDGMFLAKNKRIIVW